MTWKKLPQNVRGIVAAGSAVIAVMSGAFAAGAATRAAVGDLATMPARTQALEVRVERLDTAVAALQEATSALDSMRATTERTWCVVRAQALGRDAQRACLFGER